MNDIRIGYDAGRESYVLIPVVGGVDVTDEFGDVVFRYADDQESLMISTLLLIIGCSILPFCVYMEFKLINKKLDRLICRK